MFKYVWSLTSTPWEKLNVCTFEVAQSLRKKFADAADNNYELFVTDEERRILQDYLGRVFYNTFFIELD